MHQATPQLGTTILPPRVSSRGDTHTRVTTRDGREKAQGSLDFTDQIDEIYASRSMRVAGRQDDAIEIQPNLSFF